MQAVFANVFARIGAGLAPHASDTPAVADENLIESTFSEITRDFPHARGRSLSAHLRGTREILRAWRQPRWIQLAGLFHSIYGTEEYEKPVLNFEQRSDLRSLIGRRAERLIYLFAACRKQDIVAAASAASRSQKRVRIPARSGGAQIGVPREDLFALVVVLMANQAEQAAARDHLPGPWLAGFSSLHRLLEEEPGITPPVAQTISVSAGDETKLIALYRRALAALGTGDRQAAFGLLSECERICPLLAEPYLWRACIRLREGNRVDSVKLAKEAEARFRIWGTGWDKRLPVGDWTRIVQALQADATDGLAFLAADPGYLLVWADRGSRDARLGSMLDGCALAASGTTADRLKLFLRWIGTAIHTAQLNVYPLDPGPPWYNPKDFPIVQALEDAFPAIRNEIFAVAEQTFHAESEKIRRTGSWEVCMLYERGKKNIENCAVCPTITRIVEEHDTVRTLAGLIYISRMASQTHIAAHRGPTNMRVRCHLGIKIPSGDCAIRVGPESRQWVENKCIVFDDYYEHEAWNHTPEDRIVLIVDLWRPQLTREERALLTGLHRYALLQAESLNNYWAANAERKAAKRKGYD